MQDTKQPLPASFSDFKLSFWDFGKRQLFTAGDEDSFNRWFAQFKYGTRSQVLPLSASLKRESTTNLDSFRVVSIAAPTEVPRYLVLVYRIVKNEKIKSYDLLLIERVNGDPYQPSIEADHLVLKSQIRPITIAEWHIPTLVGL